jgi:hypothetical protein
MRMNRPARSQIRKRDVPLLLPSHPIVVAAAFRALAHRRSDATGCAAYDSPDFAVALVWYYPPIAFFM